MAKEKKAMSKTRQRYDEEFKKNAGGQVPCLFEKRFSSR